MPKRISRTVLATALAAMALPAAAHAATPGPRTGEGTDPAGDATLARDSFDGSTARLLDVRKVTASYAAGTGDLDLAFEGTSLSNATHAGIEFAASVSAPNAQGRCDGVLRAGDHTVTASGYLGEGRTEPAQLRTPDGTQVGEGTVAWPAAGDRPQIHLRSARLVGRDYRCVTGVSVVRGDSSHLDRSRDDVAPFCLAGCPAPSVPAAPAGLRATGTTLSWQAVAGAPSYVLATSTKPEGVAGRTTTYRTVSGLSFTPPRVPGAVRYYSVRASLAGAGWARPEVAIRYG